MHPVITQAIATERTREFQAHAVAEERGRQLRRAGHGRRLWLLLGIRRSERVPARHTAPRPLRGPRAA